MDSSSGTPVVPPPPPPLPPLPPTLDHHPDPTPMDIQIQQAAPAQQYPSQLAHNIQQQEPVLKAVWTGSVPKGATISHLAIPTPIIERHFIQTSDDEDRPTVLVKEVFLFQAPTHWKRFHNSKFEIVTPNGTSTSVLLNNHTDTTDTTSTASTASSTQPTTTTSKNLSDVNDNREIVISINGDHEDI